MLCAAAITFPTAGQICPRQAKYDPLFRPTYCLSVEQVESTIDAIRVLYAATTGLLDTKKSSVLCCHPNITSSSRAWINEGKRIQYAAALDKLYFESEGGILTRDRMLFYTKLQFSNGFSYVSCKCRAENILIPNLLQEALSGIINRSPLQKLKSQQKRFLSYGSPSNSKSQLDSSQAASHLRYSHLLVLQR